MKQTKSRVPLIGASALVLGIYWYLLPSGSGGAVGPVFVPADLHDAPKSSGDGDFLNGDVRRFLSNDTREYSNSAPLEKVAVVAAPIFINQGNNNKNCGFASAAMALGALSIPVPPPPKNVKILGGDRGTEETLTLRYLGTGQIYSDIPGYSFQLIQAIDATKVARAVLVPHGNKWDAVRIMKNDFGNIRARKVFLAGGVTNRGWALPIQGAWKHTVAVVAYSPSTDNFIVFDPLAAGPMEVSSSQLHAFMAAATPAVSLDLNVLLIRITPR